MCRASLGSMMPLARGRPPTACSREALRCDTARRAEAHRSRLHLAVPCLALPVWLRSAAGNHGEHLCARAGRGGGAGPSGRPLPRPQPAAVSRSCHSPARRLLCFLRLASRQETAPAQLDGGHPALPSSSRSPFSVHCPSSTQPLPPPRPTSPNLTPVFVFSPLLPPPAAAQPGSPPATSGHGPCHSLPSAAQPSTPGLC